MFSREYFQRHWLGLIFILIMLSMIIFFCNYILLRSPEYLIKNGAHWVVPDSATFRAKLNIQPVIQQSFSTPITLPAVIKIIPSHIINVVTPFTGRLLSIPKELGAFVHEGEVLVTLLSPDWIQILSDIKQSEEELIFAHKTLVRQQKLLAGSISSLRELEAAKYHYKQALMVNDRVKAKADIFLSPLDLSNNIFAIKAPQSGFIVTTHIATGSYITDTNIPLMTLVNLSSVYVEASAPETEINQFKIGEPVEINILSNNSSIHSHVEFIHHKLDVATKRFNLNMRISNTDGKLKPNMAVEVLFLQHKRRCLAVPLAAVRLIKDEHLVFVESSPWLFEARRVQIGEKNNQQVEIVSGLRENDRVLVF